MPRGHAVPALIFWLMLSAQTPADAASTTQPAVGWIWDRADAHATAPNHTIYFRYDFDLSGRPEHADLLITADNTYTLYVNGTSVSTSATWNKPIQIDIAGGLRPGPNCLGVAASNAGGPAGLFVEGQIKDGDRRIDLSSGSAWRASEKLARNWLRADVNLSRWRSAVVLGDRNMEPWHLPKLLDQAVRQQAISPPVDWAAYRLRQRTAVAELDRPSDPPGDPADHPIDRFLASEWAESKTQALPSCDDATFLRRVSLDVVGLLPNETQVREFMGDARPDKRVRLIDSLVADDVAYAEGWMAYWCDLLRNDEQTSIDGLREPITIWLFDALVSNRAYDEMVAHLLNPGLGGPQGYLKGINWRGRVNASQRPEMQAAQNVGQVFMGTNIKCASCHDHFTRPYMLDDSYGLASFFSETNLEIYRCDKPTGDIARPVFMIPGLGEVSADADLQTRHKAVSEMVTSPRNPRFARTMVNRLWKKLMGRGLVEPADDFHATAAHPALLDWLAYEFMSRDYDLKAMIRLIMTSRAYQLVSATETDDEIRAAAKQAPKFRGPTMRRLTSEQFMDGVCGLLDYWPETQTMSVQLANPNIRAWRRKVPDSLALALGRPTREQVNTARDEDASMLQMLELVNGKPLAALIQQGSQKLLASDWGRQTEPAAALDVLFLRAYGRRATDPERAILQPLLAAIDQSPEERQTGWEDVCWMLVLSSEFQYIR